MTKQRRNTTESGLDRRMKFVEDLKRLREEALAELEKKGYAVRGKTTSEIREAIKRKPRVVQEKTLPQGSIVKTLKSTNLA